MCILSAASERYALELLLAAQPSADLDSLRGLAIRDRPALRELLHSLGITKIGQRLRVEAALLADRLAAGLSNRFFARWDANSDGVLDASEVRTMLAHLRAEALGEEPGADWIQPEDKEVSRVFARMDKTTEYTLEMAEFQRWWVEKGGWEHVRDPRRW